MNIVVLAGSPKGNASVTLQSVRWLERRFPEHRFTIHRVAQRIKRLESDPGALAAVLGDMAAADLVVWAFPVYYFAVHAHLKRFIELALASPSRALDGGYATAISTSIKVMDHTAHAYVHAVSDDLGLRWLGSYSAHMRDLLDPGERDRLEAFFRQRLADVERKAPGEPATPPLPTSDFVYEAGARRTVPALRIDPGQVLVVTDLLWKDTSLRHMIRRFREAFHHPIRVLNLHDVDIAASCQGCLRCGWDNTCVFEGRDGFVPFFRERVETADLLVLAGTVRDRYLSARWKSFFDRQFFENHRPVLDGTKIGILTSGPVQALPHLREMLEAYIEMHHGELVGWVTDESHDSAVLDRQIDDLAFRLVRAHEDGFASPPSFLGVAGAKIFRDEVFSWMRFPFVSDHRAFRETGVYDFPQKDRASRVRNAFYISMARIPRIREQMYRQLRARMVQPYQGIVEGAAPAAEERKGDDVGPGAIRTSRGAGDGGRGETRGLPPT
jgi:multimeric flavodoxin WrbA